MFPIYQSLYKHLPPLFPHYQSMGKLDAPPPRIATSSATPNVVMDSNIFAAAAMAAMEASKVPIGDELKMILGWNRFENILASTIWSSFLRNDSH